MNVTKASGIKALVALGISTLVLMGMFLGNAHAADGNALTIGQANTGTNPTTLTENSGTSIGFTVTNPGGPAIGGTGSTSGVNGTGNTFGVSGDASGGASGIGVVGNGGDSGGGVRGYSNGWGVCGSTSFDCTTPGAGSHAGVIGTGSPGVFGAAVSGFGVYATSQFGTALSATSSGGTAMQVVGDSTVNGNTTFYGGTTMVNGTLAVKRSGIATVASGKSSVTVSAAGLVAKSIVLAVLQQHKTGLYVVAAVPGSGSVTIYLNKQASTNTKVGWMVIN